MFKQTTLCCYADILGRGQSSPFGFVTGVAYTFVYSNIMLVRFLRISSTFIATCWPIIVYFNGSMHLDRNVQRQECVLSGGLTSSALSCAIQVPHLFKTMQMRPQNLLSRHTNGSMNLVVTLAQNLVKETVQMLVHGRDWKGAIRFAKKVIQYFKRKCTKSNCYKLLFVSPTSNNSLRRNKLANCSLIPFECEFFIQ